MNVDSNTFFQSFHLELDLARVLLLDSQLDSAVFMNSVYLIFVNSCWAIIRKNFANKLTPYSPNKLTPHFFVYLPFSFLCNLTSLQNDVDLPGGIPSNAHDNGCHGDELYILLGKGGGVSRVPGYWGKESYHQQQGSA